MKSLLSLFLAVMMLAGNAAVARPSARTGLSGGYSRTTSMGSYFSRTTVSRPAAAPRPTYVPPSPPPYTAPPPRRPYYPTQAPAYSRQSTVINNHTTVVNHTVSGGGYPHGGGGGGMLGTFAGAAAGSALGTVVGDAFVHRNDGYVAAQPQVVQQAPAPVAPQVAPAPVPVEPPNTIDSNLMGPPVSSTQQTNLVYSDRPARVTQVTPEVANHMLKVVFIIVVIAALGIFGAVYASRRFRRVTVAPVDRVNSWQNKIRSYVVLFRNNPGLIPGKLTVTIPEYLSSEGQRSFAADHVGRQTVTAIGKVDTSAHLYLGDGVDQEFVRIFFGNHEGGPLRETFFFSHIHTASRDNWRDQLDEDGKITFANAVWGPIWDNGTTVMDYGAERILKMDHSEENRSYQESIYSRHIEGTADLEYLLVRRVDSNMGVRLHYYAGVQFTDPASVLS